MIGFERAVYTFSEGDEGCTSQVRLCAQVTGSVLGLPLEVVPVWRAGTAVGECCLLLLSTMYMYSISVPINFKLFFYNTMYGIHLHLFNRVLEKLVSALILLG